MQKLIPKKNAAIVDSEGVFYFRQEHVGMAVIVDGDLAANTIPVLAVGPDGAETAVTAGGSAVALSATNTVYYIEHAQNVKFNKGITTNEVGLYIHGMG